jgi:superfamily I DNA and/or RNA helicase
MVVQALEAMVNDRELGSACARWRQEKQTSCAIAVISVFPAQVELLRLLIKRSAILSGNTLGIEVGQPKAFAHREALIVLCSLTRSHATRAVPFSDHPRELVLALTRSVARLVLFGDPGTLSRRHQWFGALDHLDETTGPVEQALIGQLLASLPEVEEAPPQRVPAGK